MNDATFSLITNLGWTLVHFAWQGCVIGLGTAIALACMRSARAQYRYMLACSALLACLAWPALALARRLYLPVPEIVDPTFGSMLAGSNPQANLLMAVQSNLLLLVGLWAVCASLLALRMAAGLIWVARVARNPADPEWQQRLNRMALDWNITRAVRLRLADGLRTPVTAGWLRPIVLLPTSLVTGLPPELLEALLAHELAHIRRFDYLVNLGQNLIETVLFYHPAVWWISRQIRIEREQIADDLATSYLGAPRQLALALSELEKFSYSEPRLVMAANGGELATRIRRLLQPQHAASGWISLVPVLALTAGCLAMVVHAQPAGTQPVTVKARAMFSSCKKPVYPAESLRAGHTGTVVLNFLITSNGKVRESAVASSSGHLALDAAARDGISLCEFTPASRDGKPIDSWVRVQYVWMLS